MKLPPLAPPLRSPRSNDSTSSRATPERAPEATPSEEAPAAEARPRRRGGQPTESPAHGALAARLHASVSGGGLMGGMAAKGDPGRPELELKRLLDSPGYAALGPELKTRAEKALGEPPTLLSGSALSETLGSKAFQGLSGCDQAKVLDVFGASSMGGQLHLSRLASQPDRLARLLDHDFKGTRALDSLDRMATGPIASGLDRRELVGSTIQDIASPGQIANGDHGTCGPTTISYGIAKNHPGEYARLVAGIASRGGEAVLASGKTLSRVEDSIPVDGSGRGPSARLIQSAFMDFADGRLTTYSNREDSHKAFGLVRKGSGINSDQGRDLLDAIYGRAHRLDGDDAAWQRLQGRNDQDAYVALRWTSKGHALNFESSKDGRVYLRDPWGMSPTPNGTQLEDPPRRMEDWTRGLISMSEADFRARLVAVVTPAD